MAAIVEAFSGRGIETDESKLESYELAKRENDELADEPRDVPNAMK